MWAFSRRQLHTAGGTAHHARRKIGVVEDKVWAATDRVQPIIRKGNMQTSMLQEGWKDVREELPAPGDLVLLRTSHYQFAGYLDAHSVWHWFSGRIEGNTVYAWLPAEPRFSNPPSSEGQ